MSIRDKYGPTIPPQKRDFSIIFMLRFPLSPDVNTQIQSLIFKDRAIEKPVNTSPALFSHERLQLALIHIR